MPSSLPYASASDAPSPSTSHPLPPPAPLIEGEHVLCTFESSAPPADAIVVRLDEVYQAAATYYLRHQAAPSSPQLDTVDLTLDLDEHNDSQPYTVPNGNVAVDPGNGHPTKIMFREALDSRSRSPRSHRTSGPDQSTRNDPSASCPSDPCNSNGHIKPSAAPAPHPITEGKVYVHFSGRDRRMDRWVNASELVRASASSVAAAASRVVENTLIDSAVHADFVGADTNSKTVPKLTRSRRRAFEENNPVSERDVGDEVVAQLERAREESTKVRNISRVVFGRYRVDAWYFSPYPGQYGTSDKLFICGNCLKYTDTEIDYAAHCAECHWNSPPGLLIYHDAERALCVYEIDGIVSTLYCQNLCLLGKLFLDHKTLYFDVAPFLFYVITLQGEVAGFFSKEKPVFASEYNLACILTLPQHQRKGVGRFLISLSYELTRRERRTGGPERPLSDLGQVSYRSYWQHAIIAYLRSKDGAVNIATKEISQATGIRVADVVSTLKSTNLISIWKGETYGDSSPKALEAAEKKVRNPLLPLRPHLLHESITASKQTAGTARPSRPKRKKPKKTKERPKSNSRLPKSPASRTPNFTSAQIRSISSFIRKHSSAVVKELINTYSGLPAPEIRELAHETGMKVEDCLAKLQEMAASSQELGRAFSKKRERSSTPPSDAPKCKKSATHRAGPSRAGPSVFSDELNPGANDETVVGASPDEYSRPREVPVDSPGAMVRADPHDITCRIPTRGTNFVRHQSNPDLSPVVYTNVTGTDEPRAMYAHGLDENGLSDIAGDDDIQNGLVHTPRRLEFLESSGSHFDFVEDTTRRNRMQSRKHTDEIVVINSGSSE